ncbi:MAG: flavodoxin family protein [Psychrobium sp.]|nr:flavodoxin family protein [Psychrobium sp.]
MKTLLLVTHAPSPNTKRLVDSMRLAVKELSLNELNFDVKSCFDTTPEHVNHCDAIILFTPENLGYMSGAMKDFFDRIYYPCLEEKQGLPLALIVRAGHDGTGTVKSITTICTGLKWQWVQPPLVCKGDWQEAFIPQCTELISTVAVSLDCGII